MQPQYRLGDFDYSSVNPMQTQIDVLFATQRSAAAGGSGGAYDSSRVVRVDLDWFSRQKEETTISLLSETEKAQRNQQLADLTALCEENANRQRAFIVTTLEVGTAGVVGTATADPFIGAAAAAVAKPVIDSVADILTRQSVPCAPTHRDIKYKQSERDSLYGTDGKYGSSMW